MLAKRDTFSRTMLSSTADECGYERWRGGNILSGVGSGWRAFSLGACPFAVWIGQWLLGKDIRGYGDGNPGAARLGIAPGLSGTDLGRGVASMGRATRWTNVQ